MTEFKFSGMTPELQAYLDHQKGRRPLADSTYPAYREAEKAWKAAGKPTEGPLKDEKSRLHEVHYGGLKRHRKEGKRMFRNLKDGLYDAYHQAKKAWWCRDSTATDLREVPSPCGKYKVVITNHPASKGCWGYSKGKFYNAETGELIAEVLRNYGWHHVWACGHPRGDFAIAGEDYQGMTVVRLDIPDRRDWLPEAAQEGIGWCWIDAYPSPDMSLVALSGCYWACPYETIIMDFSDPLALPWRGLYRDMDRPTFDGWLSEISCRIGRYREAVNLPGHRLHDKHEANVTVEEMEEIEAIARERGIDEEDLYVEQLADELVWERPSDFEVSRAFIEEHLEHRRSLKNPFVDSDLRAAVYQHLAALDDEEQERLRTELHELFEWMRDAPERDPEED